MRVVPLPVPSSLSSPLAVALVAAFAAALAGCPVPLSRGARAQDAAQELNVNTRFGRLEVAIEKVAPASREAFSRRHRNWGGDVRIADSEMAGIRLVADENAVVTVKVAWFRPEEGELRTTVIRQKWHDYRGDWMLVDEERADGSPGLLDDPPTEKERDQAVSEDRERRAKTSVQFPTIRIGQHDSE